jgi:expansin (peptidoglycan-binding protein)
MFDSTPNDLMVGAMNQTDYAGSAICGACVSVTGPRGTITIRIVDRCPECPPGYIDLSPLAFSQLADTSLGRIPIQWHLLECAVNGPIVYHFKDGSNQWWTAVQIRNHRYPIFSLEYLTPQGTFKAVNRVDYNYFVEPAGMGTGPFTFRVTDIYGHVLVDSAVTHMENGDVQGRAQFASCSR